MTVPLGEGVSDEYRTEAVDVTTGEGGQTVSETVQPDADGAPSASYEETSPGGN